MAKSKKTPAVKRPRSQNRLAELRLRGIKPSQEQIGRLMTPPIDATTVSRHESGDRAMTTDMAKQYAQIYGVETHELFLVLPKEEPTDGKA
jgi:hypothetical protein